MLQRNEGSGQRSLFLIGRDDGTWHPPSERLRGDDSLRVNLAESAVFVTHLHFNALVDGPDFVSLCDESRAWKARGKEKYDWLKIERYIRDALEMQGASIINDALFKQTAEWLQALNAKVPSRSTTLERIRVLKQEYAESGEENCASPDD